MALMLGGVISAASIPSWAEAGGGVLPEDRDAVLTQELRRVMRDEAKKNFRSPLLEQEAAIYSIIAAIRVQDGLLALRKNALPTWVDIEQFENTITETNTHIEDTIGYITSVEDFARAMQSFGGSKFHVPEQPASGSVPQSSGSSDTLILQ